MKYNIQVLTIEGSFRIPKVLDQAKTLGLNFNLCFSFKGSEFSATQLNNLAPKKMSEFFLGRALGKNELACLLGHLKIYRVFLHNPSIDWCLVLEDDVLISPQILGLLKNLSELPTNSIIHLSPQKNLPNFILEKKYLDSINNDFGISRVLDFVPRTHGYLIDRKAANIAISSSKDQKFYFTADWPLTWIRKVNFWVTDEIICSTSELGSDILHERVSLEKSAPKENLIKKLSTTRLIHWVVNGIGISAIYGKLLGVPMRITYFELFLIPLKRKLLKDRYFTQF